MPTDFGRFVRYDHGPSDENHPTPNVFRLGHPLDWDDEKSHTPPLESRKSELDLPTEQRRIATVAGLALAGMLAVVSVFRNPMEEIRKWRQEKTLERDAVPQVVEHEVSKY